MLGLGHLGLERRLLLNRGVLLVGARLEPQGEAWKHLPMRMERMSR